MLPKNHKPTTKIVKKIIVVKSIVFRIWFLIKTLDEPVGDAFLYLFDLVDS